MTIKWNPDMDAALLKARGEGRSWEEVGSIVGVGYSTVRKRADLLGTDITQRLSRGSISGRAALKEPAHEMDIVKRLEVLHAKFPSYGYRRLAAKLLDENLLVNPKRVRHLVRLHGLQSNLWQRGSQENVGL